MQVFGGIGTVKDIEHYKMFIEGAWVSAIDIARYAQSAMKLIDQ